MPAIFHSELQSTGQAAMQKLLKIQFLHINEIFKIRGRFEIIIEKKIPHVYGSHHEKGLKLPFHSIC